MLHYYTSGALTDRGAALVFCFWTSHAVPTITLLRSSLPATHPTSYCLQYVAQLLRPALPAVVLPVSRSSPGGQDHTYYCNAIPNSVNNPTFVLQPFSSQTYHNLVYSTFYNLMYTVSHCYLPADSWVSGWLLLMGLCSLVVPYYSSLSAFNVQIWVSSRFNLRFRCAMVCVRSDWFRNIHRAVLPFVPCLHVSNLPRLPSYLPFPFHFVSS